MSIFRLLAEEKKKKNLESELKEIEKSYLLLRDTLKPKLPGRIRSTDEINAVLMEISSYIDPSDIPEFIEYYSKVRGIYNQYSKGSFEEEAAMLKAAAKSYVVAEVKSIVDVMNAAFKQGKGSED